jgi:hypothetical protein
MRREGKRKHNMINVCQSSRGFVYLHRSHLRTAFDNSCRHRAVQYSVQFSSRVQYLRSASGEAKMVKYSVRPLDTKWFCGTPALRTTDPSVAEASIVYLEEETEEAWEGKEGEGKEDGRFLFPSTLTGPTAEAITSSLNVANSECGPGTEIESS